MRPAPGWKDRRDERRSWRLEMLMMREERNLERDIEKLIYKVEPKIFDKA
jgi:hypothetical protein